MVAVIVNDDIIPDVLFAPTQDVSEKFNGLQVDW